MDWCEMEKRRGVGEVNDLFVVSRRRRREVGDERLGERGEC